MSIFECVGNTEEEVTEKLQKWIDRLEATDTIILGKKSLYGNFEDGYKVVQHYEISSENGC